MAITSTSLPMLKENDTVKVNGLSLVVGKVIYSGILGVVTVLALDVTGDEWTLRGNSTHRVDVHTPTL